MSSNIEIIRVCKACGKDFTARTTKTLYCSHKCNSADYKAKQRSLRIEKSNKETITTKIRPIEELKAKEFLTVQEVAVLLNTSKRSIYYYLKAGTIKYINLGQRVTRIKRSDIDSLFN